MSAETWKNARNILCVRPDNLGDVLMTTPAFRALKSLNPDVRLTLLTSKMGAGIARLVPEIDEVIEFNLPWVNLDGALPDSAAVLDLVNTLKARRFDAAVIFNVFSQNPLPMALLCYLAEIPLRLAYCRESPYALLTDWLPDTEPFTDIEHEVTRQLRLVGMVGAATVETRLSVRVDAQDRARALDKLRAAGVDSSVRWLALHPGVSELKRRYPPEQYAEVGRELIRKGYQVVVTGGETERGLAAQVVGEIGAGAVSMAGLLSLGEFVALIDAAPLLIANNTGPVHIAAAVGTPVVVLYACTNPQHTPWQVANRVLYFDVPEHLRSKNVLLVQTYARMAADCAHPVTPQAIVDTALDLLRVTSLA